MTTTLSTLSERSLALLQDPALRKKELERAMAQYPTLTQSGFAWHLHSKNQVRFDLPTKPEEILFYNQARHQLAHQGLTEDQCLGLTNSHPLGCQSPRHQGEIILALKYLTHCQYSNDRNDTSYAIKHRAERLEHPYYVSNGAMILAAAMTDARIEHQAQCPNYNTNTQIHIIEPKMCGTPGVEPRAGCQKTHIPPGNKNRVCDECRN